MVETPDLTLLRQQNAELLRQLETSTARLAKVEGEFGVLKHSQSMTLCGLWIVAALLIVVIASVAGFGIYELRRIDQAGDRISALNDKVNDLPGKIGADLRDITKTFADVVLGATKQTQQPAPTSPIRQGASTPPVQPPASISPVQQPEPTTPAYYDRWR
jgi:hypothetical protein